MTTSNPQAESMRALYAQIEEICRQFKQIRNEASGIVENSAMPDATLHLNDVLQATEEAATAILDAAIAIGAIVDGPTISKNLKDQINEQLSRIFEAASFQDISGQRIKKVLQHLNELEGQLSRLSENARGSEAQAPKAPVDPLLNGPALSSQAPSQADIDHLFNS